MLYSINSFIFENFDFNINYLHTSTESDICIIIVYIYIYNRIAQVSVLRLDTSHSPPYPSCAGLLPLRGGRRGRGTRRRLSGAKCVRLLGSSPPSTDLNLKISVFFLFSHTLTADQRPLHCRFWGWCKFHCRLVVITVIRLYLIIEIQRNEGARGSPIRGREAGDTGH